MLSCPNLLLQNSQIDNQYYFKMKNIYNSKRYETESSVGRNSTTMSSYFTNDIDFNYSHNNYLDQKYTLDKKNFYSKQINYFDYNESEDENYYEEEKIEFDDIIVPQQCGYLFKKVVEMVYLKKHIINYVVRIYIFSLTVIL